MPSLNGIYLILDRRYWKRTYRAKIEKALKEGLLCAVQFRGKEIADRLFLKEAREVQSLVANRAVFLLNDRVDIACLLDCGVHLGQEDLPVKEARRLLGKKKIIGLSTHNRTQFQKAQSEPVDYVALGPVLPTKTKSNPEPPLGFQKALKIAKATTLPVVAIGGLEPKHLPLLQKEGIACIALCRAFFELPLSQWKSLYKRGEEKN